MARTFPDAPIYTTLYDADSTFPEFRDLDVRASRLNRIPIVRRNHRVALPLLPLFSQRIRIDADVVIASSSGWAHGFATNGRKIVYCHSPARWLYQPDRYLGDHGSALVSGALRLMSPGLRRWDRRAASTADSYLANSTVVQEGIQQTYGLASTIVPAPYAAGPTGTDESVGAGLPRAGYFLVVSRLLPYKNVGSVVDAFRLRPDRRLVVVGTGPDRDRLVENAPSNVEFLANLSDAEMAWVYDHAVGLIAASYEDFGLTPLEAAARGKPSAVLRWGGFLDTMVEGETAVFFDTPAPGLICEAVDRLAERSWDTGILRARAQLFSEAAFAEALVGEVERVRSL